MADKTTFTSEQRVERIIALLNAHASDFATVYSNLLELRTLTHEHIAATVTLPLNTELMSRPQVTREDKQGLCRWANLVARSLGIAARDPKGGGPAMLHSAAGRKPAEGRFEIELLDPKNRQRTFSSRRLPTLEYIAHIASTRESLADYWARRLPRPGGESYRTRT